MILKIATESRKLQEISVKDQEPPVVGARIFFSNKYGVRSGIVWSYDVKSSNTDEDINIIHLDKIPIVNKNFIEASKEAGDYYIYPPWALMVKLIPSIMFKTISGLLIPKLEDTEFMDKTYKKVFRLLKKRNLTLEEAYKKYGKENIDFYIKKGFLELSKEISPYVKLENFEGLSEKEYILKKTDINIVSGDYKKFLKSLNQDEQTFILTPSKYMFDELREALPEAFYLTSPKTSYEARSYYENALRENGIFVGTSISMSLPFINLKNIVVLDDMYGDAYKSKKEPFLDFRRMAYYIAKHYGAKLYYASTTMSINGFFLYKEQKAKHLYVDLKLPPIHVIKKEDKTFLISNKTLELIKQNLDKKILFYVNKSGYSYAYCPRCDALDTCFFCEHYTTYFKSLNTIKCTKCGKVNQNNLCSRCGGPLQIQGAGVEQYQEYITSYFGIRDNFYFEAKDDNFDVVFIFLLENLLFAPELSAREIYHNKLWNLCIKAKELCILETTQIDKASIESLLNQNQLIFLEDELQRRATNQDPPFTKAISVEMPSLDNIQSLYQELLEEGVFYVSKPRYFYEKGNKFFRLLIKVKKQANLSRLKTLLKKYKNYKVHVGIESFV